MNKITIMVYMFYNWFHLHYCLQQYTQKRNLMRLMLRCSVSGSIAGADSMPNGSDLIDDLELSSVSEDSD